jgi:hypothetical protein
MKFKIQEEKTNLSFDQFKRRRNKGYVEIGKGAYATAYARPDEDVCYKVGLFPYKQPWSDGYLGFLQQVHQAAENPFFPKIQELRIYHNAETNQSWYCVAMEKLKPLPKNWEESRKVSPFSKVCLRVVRLADGEKLKQFKGFLRLLYGVSKTDTELHEVYESLVEAKPAFGMDLHDGNFRMRGDQVVITDPYAGVRSKNAAVDLWETKTAKPKKY